MGHGELIQGAVTFLFCCCFVVVFFLLLLPRGVLIPMRFLGWFSTATATSATEQATGVPFPDRSPAAMNLGRALAHSPVDDIILTGGDDKKVKFWTLVS